MKTVYNPAMVLLAFVLFFSLTSCTKDSPSIETQLQVYNGSLKFNFLPGSIEKVFYSEMPWEAKALNYYNIIKEDTTWRMFYKSYGYNDQEFDGSFCIAKSANGALWNREPLNNNTNIVIDGENDKGITGNFVFIDSADVQYHYKMICSKLISEKQKTFLYGSVDGVHWVLIKQLFDKMQDSQFSIIRLNNKYYLFSRYNDYNPYQRAIGLSELDNNFNILQPSLLLLKAPINDQYPHIYNSAASKINDSTIILFPTYYDDNDGTVELRLLYTKNMKDYYLIKDNINDDLFPGQKVNWAIVSPGVIPTGEPDTYWVYYYKASVKHNSIPNAAQVGVTYYRIKLVIN
jgi:hypothetical protein